MPDFKGSGEQAESQRSRLFWGTLGVCGLVGGIIGAAMVIGTGNNVGGDMSAGWAIAAAIFTGVGLLGGSWYFFRIIDEVELRDNLIAGTVGVYFYAVSYPIWYFLWKGGLVVEPIHEALYIATLLVLTIVYLWKKLRP